MIYVKVWRTKTGQKLVTIPKSSMIREGDYVQIKLVPDEVMNE